jgi:hypothetical protein
LEPEEIMTRQERNARLRLALNEKRLPKIRAAQFRFLADEISQRKLPVKSRQQLLDAIYTLPFEVQAVAGLKTTASKEKMADKWEDVRFLVAMMDATVIATSEYPQEPGRPVPWPEVLARAAELLRIWGIIRGKPEDKKNPPE